jgi:hypothetical protein
MSLNYIKRLYISNFPILPLKKIPNKHPVTSPKSKPLTLSLRLAKVAQAPQLFLGAMHIVPMLQQIVLLKLKQSYEMLIGNWQYVW